jgi:hypothetical protein
MRDLLKPLLSSLLMLTAIAAHAQLDGLFAPFDCREHAEFFYNEPVAEPVELPAAELTAAVEELTITVDTVNGWKQWTFVENFAFGKDRGTMSMITDLEALHPYFRDRIKTLIATCRAKGIELAVVESYRTHAKQNEYKANIPAREPDVPNINTDSRLILYPLLIRLLYGTTKRCG